VRKFANRKRTERPSVDDVSTKILQLIPPDLRTRSANILMAISALIENKDNLTLRQQDELQELILASALEFNDEVDVTIKKARKMVSNLLRDSA
jgi:hypothetical protein